MGMYVVLTAFLYQRGSSESKPIDSSAPQDEDPRDVTPKEGTPWPVRRGGWVLVLYEHSLAIAGELAERIHRGRSDSGVIDLFCGREALRNQSRLPNRTDIPALKHGHGVADNQETTSTSGGHSEI